MVDSRNKGAAYERELAKEFRFYGYETRRGQQYCGANGDADVIGLPHIHIEAKRVEKLNLTNAMSQSKAEAKDGEFPVVIHRQSVGGHTMKNLYEELDTMCLRCECRGDLKCGTVAHCKGE
jgi:predicted urease superfamily metal-dependent hydrolase